MKTMAIILLNFMLIGIMQAQTTHQLTVTLDGFTTDEGRVYVGLYTQNSWLVKTYRGAVKKIENGTIKVTFKDLPSGKYAISAFHDMNGNGKLDSDEYGRLVEAYACSRGAIGRFGPPQWKDAEFDLKADKTVEVHF